MNDPLKRKMFRQVGMSKQPIGILASSPELMTTAQKAMASGQPIKAKSATSVNFMPQLNLVPGTNRKTPFGGYETKKKEESPLSAFGGEGPYISPMIATTGSRDFLYELGGDRVKKQIFDKAGEDAKKYYEAQRKGMLPDEINAKPIKKDDNKSSGISGADIINTSTANALEKAVAKVTSDTEVQQQISEENAIAGVDNSGRDFTEEQEKIEKKKSVPELGGNDYGLGVKKNGNKNNLSSNVTSDNTSVNAGVIDLNKMIAGSTPGSSENINANKKINNLISKTIADKKVKEATDLNLIASGAADEETVKELSDDEKALKLKERIKTMFGKDTDQMGLESDLEGMNLVMLGLRIAAGESPNAMTNIAKGALASMEDVAAQKKEKLAKMEKIDALVVSTLLGREDKEIDQKNRLESKKIDQKHDVSMFKMQDSASTKKDIRNMNFQVLINDKNNLFKLGLKNIDLKMHGEKLKNSMNIAVMNLESAEKRTLAQIQSSEKMLEFKQISSEQHAEKLFQLNKELDLEKAMISNMPKGYALGLMEGKKKGLTGEKLADFAATQGSKFAKSRTLTGSETLKGSLFGIVEAQVKDGISIDEALKNTLNNPDFQKLHQTELTKLGLFNKPSAPTLASLGLGEMPEGTVLGQDGKPYTGSGPKFVVGAGGTIQKG